MKILYPLLSAAFVCATIFSGNAQCPNAQSNLNISTGFDPSANTTAQPNTFDPMWKLVQSPTPPTGWVINLGGPAYVIPQSSSWHAAGTSSEFINAFNTNQSVLDNWGLSNLPYIFEREFCICDPNGGQQEFQVTIDFNLQADNWAEVYLVSPSGSQTLLYSQNYVYSTANFTNPVDHYNGVHTLTPGTYKLQMHLRNRLVVMGLALDGTVSSSGLLSDLGCHPEGSIAGSIYNDCDQSGDRSISDAPALNVQVELRNANNEFVAKTSTDQNGFYFFEDVVPGTYTVNEMLPGGQASVAISPANGVHANVTVSGAELTQLDFLNDNPAWANSTVPCQIPLGLGDRLTTADGPLSQLNIYPNPADGQFNLQFDLASASPVALEIMDLKGAVVFRQNLGDLNAGSQNLAIGAELTAGVYVCVVSTGNARLHQKLMVH